MSREIKYRAWVKERQAYFLVSNLFWGGGDTPLKVEISDNGSYREYINGEVIIEQYTGLKDKNGKEIYEGNIIRLYGKILFIKWSENAFAFIAKGEKEYYWLDKSKSECEIVGNVHENSQLLEGRNNDN